MAILVIFVVIIGILMMKNKNSYTAPIAPSATDPTSVFTPAVMAYLFSSDGVFSPAGNTWIKSDDGINWLKWLSDGINEENPIAISIGGIYSYWIMTTGSSKIDNLSLKYPKSIKALFDAA